MDAVPMILLFDYYGELLTPRQKQCFDLRYNQDLSLGEIAQVLHVSRQGVYDNLSRAEALLRNMEEKTGCAGRDQRCRRAAAAILAAARELEDSSEEAVCALAQRIISAASSLEE